MKAEEFLALFEERPSWLLNYLPEIYTEESFLTDFLRIFESIWLPLNYQLNHLYAYFDPDLAPAEFLPWLATWLDLALDENWPEEKRRRLIRSATDLYRTRGTIGGLQDYLAIFLGTTPQIIEDQNEDFYREYHFTVLYELPGLRTELERVQLVSTLRRIIDEEKPAHTIYTLVERSDNG